MYTSPSRVRPPESCTRAHPGSVSVQRSARSSRLHRSRTRAREPRLDIIPVKAFRSRQLPSAPPSTSGSALHRQVWMT